MIEIQLPELPSQPLAMSPDSVVRDGSTQTTEPAAPSTALAGRLRLGGPIAVPISAEFVKDDDALRTFVEQESSRYAYQLVHLSITASSEPGDPRFERVGIVLGLSADAGESTSTSAPPIAWSMTPLKVTEASQLATTWRLGPQVKIFGAEMTLGSMEHSRTRPSAQVYLEGRNELREDPTWELRRTHDMHIQGSHRLAMVIRTPANVTTRIAGTVYATVVRGVRPWREKTELPDLLALSAIV